MKKYEITFVVGENYTEDKAKEIAKNVRELIEKEGGKIDVDLFWGKKKLVYKIAKNTFGYYFVLVFFIDPTKIAELNKELKMNERIIRYLMVDFVEKTPFFEEVAERKNKVMSGRSTGEDVIEENLKKTAKKKKPLDSARGEEDRIVEEVKEEVPEVQEEVKEEEEKKEKIEEKIKEVKEEIEEVKQEEESKEEPKESSFTEASEDKEKTEAPAKEEAKEEAIPEKPKVKKDDDLAERKPERKQMNEDERKAQLEKKLAELLKEEDE